MTDTPLEFDELDGIFEERAEHLSEHDLAAWTTLTPHDETIIQKLMGPGAKLLTGPRGSGKSTLLRIAYFRQLKDRTNLPAYVNYAKSLALEPMFHRQSNAIELFRQWLLAKIVVGLDETVDTLAIDKTSEFTKAAQTAKILIRSLSIGDTNINHARLAPSDVVEHIEEILNTAQLRRCVLLLDDAAHAFSPEQQREFFEVFRELRSRHVSPKAAVYPGITSYSPFFHVGHEAETLEAGSLGLRVGEAEPRVEA